MSLERITIVSPAYARRPTDGAKNYGIGACRINFIVKGPLGAVQFVIGTDWYTDSAREHLRGFPASPHDEPVVGWDVGYHSPRPRYEGQKPVKQTCDLVGGGTCYYDGSTLRADAWLKHFIIGGSDWMWPHLEALYRHEFEKGPEIEP